MAGYLSYTLSAVFGAALLAIAAAEIAVRRLSRGRIRFRAEEVPVQRAALVLGTSPVRRDGSPNPYFRNRILAAAELWHARRVAVLVVSGADGRKDGKGSRDGKGGSGGKGSKVGRGGSEPQAMREALMAEGVPDKAIRTDCAGFRTLDSVVRMREIFGYERFAIVSQPFHGRRAVVMARACGIDAVGYAAAEVRTGAWMRIWLRERLARVRLFADLAIGTRPKTPGGEYGERGACRESGEHEKRGESGQRKR